MGKIPWKGAWHSTPVFLPGESPWTEEPSGLQSLGSRRVRHHWSTKHSTAQLLYPHLTETLKLPSGQEISYRRCYSTTTPVSCCFRIFWMQPSVRGCLSSMIEALLLWNVPHPQKFMEEFEYEPPSEAPISDYTLIPLWILFLLDSKNFYLYYQRESDHTIHFPCFAGYGLNTLLTLTIFTWNFKAYILVFWKIFFTLFFKAQHL